MAFEDELIESLYIVWEAIEDALRAGKEGAMTRLKRRYPLIDDVEKEIGWWACFEENKSGSGTCRRVVSFRRWLGSK